MFHAHTFWDAYVAFRHRMPDVPAPPFVTIPRATQPQIPALQRSGIDPQRRGRYSHVSGITIAFPVVAVKFNVVKNHGDESITNHYSAEQRCIYWEDNLAVLLATPPFDTPAAHIG